MQPGMKLLKSTACAIGTVLAMLVGNVQAQQVPIPQTAAEVPGPAPGPMTKAYVQMVGRMAYFWGWPLVYVYNQRTRAHEGSRTRSPRRRSAYQPDESGRDADRLR